MWYNVFMFLYYFYCYFRPTNKPILQNFYFRNPDDEGKQKIGQKSSSSNSLASMLGSRSSQPYTAIASMGDMS